ncbi:TPA: hypothetical protein ACGSUC_004447, partial [Yersinia enterocolitica]
YSFSHLDRSHSCFPCVFYWVTIFIDSMYSERVYFSGICGCSNIASTVTTDIFTAHNHVYIGSLRDPSFMCLLKSTYFGMSIRHISIWERFFSTVS